MQAEITANKNVELIIPSLPLTNVKNSGKNGHVIESSSKTEGPVKPIPFKPRKNRRKRNTSRKAPLTQKFACTSSFVYIYKKKMGPQGSKKCRTLAQVHTRRSTTFGARTPLFTSLKPLARFLRPLKARTTSVTLARAVLAARREQPLGRGSLHPSREDVPLSGPPPGWYGLRFHPGTRFRATGEKTPHQHPKPKPLTSPPSHRLVERSRRGPTL